MSSRYNTQIRIVPDTDIPVETDVILPQKLVKKYLIEGKQPIKLSYGLKTLLVSFQSGKALMVRESVAQSLSISPDADLFGFHYDVTDRRLIIGPLIGILMSGISKTSDELFGEMTGFCKEVDQASRSKGGRAVFFTLAQINEATDVINGWMFKDQQWVRSALPTPYCVHNRINSRRTEKREDTQMKINLLKQRGVFFYNEQFLDKWEIAEQLKGVEYSSGLFPYTKLFTGSASLYEMLQRYPEVYLKPTGGSLGKGIIQVIRTHNSYICQYQRMEDTITKKYESLGSLGRMLDSRIGNRPYIIQQGIDLIKQNGSIVDFRALVQKNWKGKWSLTSIVGRRGPEDSIVSNVSTGGTILSLREALENADAPSLQVDRIITVMKTSALKITQMFELGAKGHYAELGIDFAVDHTGRVWVLEINSKPSKAGHSVGSLVKEVRPSVNRLIDFCFYQSGFNLLSNKKRSKPIRLKE